MKKTTHFQVHKQPLVTRQDILYVLVLIAICLWFSLAPAHSFGQPALGPLTSDTFSTHPPLATTANSEPAPASVMQAATEIPAPATAFSDLTPSASPVPEQSFAFIQTDAPAPATASASPVTANQIPSMQSLPVQPQVQQPQVLQQLQRRGPQRGRTATNTEHPFRQYWGVPNDPQTKITGKPMTVAELFTNTRSAMVRCQLLQAYWELSGLLAIYHFRCETETLAGGAAGMQQEGMMTLLREQRRTAEVEFIKQQWVLAELLNQYKGRTLRESELPIPADYPLYPRYQTFADQIARTKRTQYLGRMIPVQEQLIETKNDTWKAASEMIPSASQPFFAVSNQRTMAFLDLTQAVIEYNKMIAEYALETIPPNVSQHQLVGAVVRLPKNDVVLKQSQPQQRRAGDITLTQYEAPERVMAPSVQPVTYEYQPEYQSAPTAPSLPMLNVIETEESEYEPQTPAFLRDYM